MFLRVWQDAASKLDGMLVVRVTAYEFFRTHDPDNLGWRERLEHLEPVRQGATTYLIMCRAVDPDAHPREVAGCNERELFLGGNLLERDGDVWIQLRDRVPVRDVMVEGAR